MEDLIKKQDAINAVAELVSSMSVCISIDECHGMKRMQGMAVRTLDELPSAQPEIIRCKDCKYRNENKILDSSNSKIGWHPCDIVMTNNNWFCADAERRTDERSDRQTGCD